MNSEKREQIVLLVIVLGAFGGAAIALIVSLVTE